MLSNQYIRVTVYPKDSSENVSLDTTITLKFSQPMVKESVEDGSRILLLEGSSIVPASYNYSAPQKELEIKPAKLLPGVTYTVKVLAGEKGPYASGILSIDGKDILVKHQHNFFFTTEEASPEEDLPLEDGNTLPEEGEGPTEGEGVPPEEAPQVPEEDSGVIFDPLEGELGGLVLEESFPEIGDLVDLDSEMVLVFNKEVNAVKLQENIFVKETSINPLLEKLNEDKLIKGSIKTEGKKDNAKELIFKVGTTLLPGKEYQLVIKKGAHEELSSDIRINFQTLFERMFADVDTVRLVLGAFADRLTDLDLAKLINQQSNSIYQLASMMDSFNQSDWAQENGVIITFPYAASQYVVYSTAYYAILGRSLEGSSGMSESIRLADLSVAASSESSDNLSDLLELLKAEFERWWNVLQGEAEEIEPGMPNPNRTMTIATRGGDEDPYPDFQTRVPFNELGGRDS